MPVPRMSLWFVNQQVSQLAAIDSALPKILRTNTGIEVLFRCNAEDARLLAPVLGAGAPRRGDRRPDPIRELVTLRDREFLFWAKREAFGPQKLRSLDLDMDAFRAAARTVDPAIRQAMEQGSVALPRRELEALVAPARGNRAAAPAVPEPPPPAPPRGRRGRFSGLG